MKENSQYKKLIDLSIKVGQLSKDESTKVGFVLLNEDNDIMVYSYNGMMNGANDKDHGRNQRPEKYKWYEHAERNGLYTLARSHLMNKVMVLTKHPNMESARAIVSSGISTVYYLNKGENYDARVISLFEENNVKLFQASELTGRTKRKVMDNIGILEKYASTFSENDDAACILEDGTFKSIKSGFGVYKDIMKEYKDKYSINDSGGEMSLSAPEVAILNVIKKEVKGLTGVSSWFPCPKCSAALAYVQLGTIVSPEVNFEWDDMERWKQFYDISTDLLGKSMNLVLIEDESYNPYKDLNQNVIKNKSKLK